MGNRKPKDVFSYSQRLFEIVEGVAVRGETYEVTVPTITVARKLRGKFYAFRQGLEHALARGRANIDTPEAMQLAGLENTLQFARSTVCWFDERAGEPVKVVYMSKEATPEAQFYEAALRSGSAAGSKPAQPSDDEETARRLAELVGKKDDKDNPYY